MANVETLVFYTKGRHYIPTHLPPNVIIWLCFVCDIRGSSFTCIHWVVSEGQSIDGAWVTDGSIRIPQCPGIIVKRLKFLNKRHAKLTEAVNTRVFYNERVPKLKCWTKLAHVERGNPKKDMLAYVSDDMGVIAVDDFSSADMHRDNIVATEIAEVGNVFSWVEKSSTESIVTASVCDVIGCVVVSDMTRDDKPLNEKVAFLRTKRFFIRA